MSPSSPRPTKARSGLQTLIYGYCSRNCPSSDKPLQIASLIYGWLLLLLSPLSILAIPLKVSSPCCRTKAEQLCRGTACLHLTSRSPVFRAPPLGPFAPINQHHLPAALQGQVVNEHVEKHTVAPNQGHIRFSVQA